jgi:hypothetical protein
MRIARDSTDSPLPVRAMGRSLAPPGRAAVTRVSTIESPPRPRRIPGDAPPNDDEEVAVQQLETAVPAPVDVATLRVTAKTVVADGVLTLELAAPTGARLPDWTPGSHIDLVLANGMTRQYSLCGDRWDPFTYRVGVLRETAGRGARLESEALLTALARRVRSIRLDGPTKRHRNNTLRAWECIPVRVEVG